MGKQERSTTILDLIATVSIAVLFGLALAYVHACEHLQPTPPKGDRP